MTLLWRSIMRICAVALIASAVCPQAFGQKPSDPSRLVGDEQAIHDYILTMAKVQTYMDVARKLIAAAQNDPALNAEMKTIASTNGSNLDKVALADRSPHIASFLKSNDTTTRDFVMTPLTLFSALDAVMTEERKGKVSPFVNAVNIKFVRDHRTELEQYEQNATRPRKGA
jgi:hypothetical protein